MKKTPFLFCLILTGLMALALAACQNGSPQPSQAPLPVVPLPAVKLEQPHIMFISNRDNTLSWYIMKLDGSDVQKMDFSKAGAQTINGIEWIPALDAFLIDMVDKDGQADFYLIDVQGNILQRVTNDFFGESDGDYNAETGLFVFVCIQSDLDICTVRADGANLVNLTLAPSREARPLWVDGGKAVIFVTNRAGVPGLWKINADGSSLVSLSTALSPEGNPYLSPDKTWFVYDSQRDLNAEIYRMDVDGQNQANLTNNPASDTEPKISPDGKYVVFQSDRDNGHDLYVMQADGSQIINITQTPDVVETNFIWSLDGDQIVFSAAEGGTSDIFIVNMDGSGKKNLTQNPADDGDPIWVGH